MSDISTKTLHILHPDTVEFFPSYYWNNPSLNNFSLLRIGILGDGSCFLHSLLCAFYGNLYRSQDYSKKQSLVKVLRNSLANNITFDIFKQLGNGNLCEIYDFNNYRHFLNDPESWIGDESLEFISNFFSIDIYILSDTLKSIYILGSDISLLYRSRPSIILFYINEKHYELISLFENNTYTLIFDPYHPLIKLLYSLLV